MAEMETLRKISYYRTDEKQEGSKEPYKLEKGWKREKEWGCLHSDLNVASYQKLKIQSNWRNFHTDILSQWITSGVTF